MFLVIEFLLRNSHMGRVFLRSIDSRVRRSWDVVSVNLAVSAAVSTSITVWLMIAGDANSAWWFFINHKAWTFKIHRIPTQNLRFLQYVHCLKALIFSDNSVRSLIRNLLGTARSGQNASVANRMTIWGWIFSFFWGWIEIAVHPMRFKPHNNS